MVPLRDRGASPSFWCIHPGALDVGCYRALADALEHPFRVVRVAELEAQYDAGPASEGGLARLDELARRCADELERDPSRGPYRLGGWSLGGVLAYATARELQARGHAVGVVALLDAPTPDVSAQMADYDAPVLWSAFASYLAARAGRGAEPVVLDRHAPRSAQAAAVLAWAEPRALLPAGCDAEWVGALFDVWRHGLQRSVRRIAASELPASDLPLVYLRATHVLEAFAEAFPRSDEAWARRTRRPMPVLDVEGDHYGMFLRPHVESLARALARALAMAEHGSAAQESHEG